MKNSKFKMTRSVIPSKTRNLVFGIATGFALAMTFIFNCLFTGCAGFLSKKTTGKITTINENLSPDRLIDLGVVKKLAGYKKFLFISNANYTDWFEGFLRGEIVNEDGVPVENIQIMVDGIGFENAVTDVNGIYKIRFSVPIVKGLADADGKLIIHPRWESELEIKGSSYQPAIKDAPFRIYYNGNVGGVVALNEGKLPPKIVDKKITLKQYKTEIKKKKAAEKSAVTGKPTKKPEKPAPKKEDIGFGDDLFKQLENFNK